MDSKLKQHGHDFWGWMVYRCNYSADSEWAEFKEKLEADSRESFEFYNATEAMLKKHVWTFVEDRERLENATKSDVRRIFNEWVNSPEAAAEQPNAKQRSPVTHMSRYRYCIYVDQASLRSVLEDSDWHLILIDRSWVPEEEEEPDEGNPYEDDDEEELTEEQREELRLANTWPEIEGCTEEDVGWCKMGIAVMVGHYVIFCEPYRWELYYERPPKIA